MISSRLAPLLLLLSLVAACGSSSNDARPADIEIPPADSDGGVGADGGDSGDPSTPAEGTIDAPIQRYDYAFDLSTGRSRSKLTIDVPEPGGACVNVSSRVPVAEQATWNGAAATKASVANDVLEICGAPHANGPLEIAASADVPVRTQFGLDVGFSRQLDLADGEFTYLLSWVGGCDLFGPCDANPARLVEMHFDIAHPADTVVLCPGTLTVATNGTSTQCVVKGAPTYSGFGFAADAKWQRSLFTQGSGVDVVFYEVPGGQLASSLSPATVQEFLAWITDLLGPLPYGPELRVAGAPTKWLGFEHPANIILKEDLPFVGTNHVDPVMHVLMHEIVHQWAGDRTTLATTNDFVWKEATAEYLSYVFEDEKRPAGEALATRVYWDVGALNVNHHPRPTDNPRVDQFYGDVYAPGPMVLYVQLEQLLGRPAVLGGIKRFLSEPGARSVEDLRAALEATSGVDLKPYFNAWVEGAGKPEWPTFSVTTTTQSANQLAVTATQQNASARLYGCKVELDVVGPSGTKRAVIDFGVAPTSASASTTIAFEGAVTKVVLDPDHKLIARGVGVEQASASQQPMPVWIF